MYKLIASQAVEMPIFSNKGIFCSKLGIGALLAGALLLFSACSPANSESDSSAEVASNTSDQTLLTDDISKASYGMGYSLGENVKSQQADMLNYDAFLLGAKDSFAGVEQRLTEEALKEAFEAVQAARVEQQIQEKENIMEEGRKFLAEVATHENVVTLESGMLYEIIVAGDGPKPAATDKVRTHYHGTLMDGTVFDSSVDRGQPATFPVSGVIQGWVEALQLMPVGSKWKLYIPSNLAYGERGAGGLIGPGATLVFEVELLEIVGEE